MDKTFDWFAARGLDAAPHRVGPRLPRPRSTGRDVDLRCCRPGEIPRELAAGRIHLGVTGSDLIQERSPAGTGRSRR
jgi:ATP phosphoribosyltransferase